MNICIIISSLQYGGSSQVAVDLACGLKNKGNKVTVVSLWDRCLDKYSSRLNNEGIEIKSCKKRNKLDFMCYKRLKKILSEGNFDLINTHLTSLFYCFLAKPAQTIVHTIHSVPDLDIPKYYRLIMKRWIKKHCVVFVGCSNVIFEKANDYYKTSNIKLITNGFNAPVREADISEKKTFDFIYIGRLVSMKNINEIIFSFSLLANQDKKLCIVGDGPEKKHLMELCSQKHLVNVNFVGWTDNVFSYLKQSKVFCLFSDFEGGPICLLEAMSCGLPVICSDIGGNKTYTEDGKNGFLFKLHDVNDASQKMSLLLEDSMLYDRMSKAAIKTAKDNSVENMINKYECLFKELCNE